MATKKSKSSGSRSSSGTSALTMLKEDHAMVQKLFKEFEKSEDDDEKQQLATEICMELTVHAAIEEEIFYPAAREALEEDDMELLDEAEVEHASAKELIAQIEAGSPDEELWDAKVTVLGEYIKHHVQEEEEELFAKVRESELDVKALGEQLATRKEELMSRQNNSGKGSKASKETRLNA